MDHAPGTRGRPVDGGAKERLVIGLVGDGVEERSDGLVDQATLKLAERADGIIVQSVGKAGDWVKRTLRRAVAQTWGQPDGVAKAETPLTQRVEDRAHSRLLLVPGRERVVD